MRALGIPAAIVDAYQDIASLKPTPLTAWQTLVERYKDDRAVCNCREAWYMRIGDTLSVWDGRGWKFDVKNDNPRACQYGCEANQLFCKTEIGARVCEEFGVALKEAQP